MVQFVVLLKYFVVEIDEVKVEFVVLLQSYVDVVLEWVFDWFESVLVQVVEVWCIVVYEEVLVSGGYYMLLLIDGLRFGIFWINLKSVVDVFIYIFKILIFYEVVFGYYFQVVKVFFVSGMLFLWYMFWFGDYGEGWVFYVEEFVVEMGFYEDDLFGDFGCLCVEFYCVVCFVVDIGIYNQWWSCEWVIDMMVVKMGESCELIICEID